MDTRPFPRRAPAPIERAGVARRQFLRNGAAVAAAGIAGAALGPLVIPRVSAAATPVKGRRPTQAELDQLTIAVIGTGQTGIWASLQAQLGGVDLTEVLGTEIVWQPGFAASLPVMEALRAGDVDFTFATSTAIVNAVGAGVPLVPLASFALPTDTVDLLVHADSDIQGAADLAGKRIADQNGTTGTYSLIKYLESADLRLDDVEHVSLTAADAFPAFESGEVDAWISWQPQMALALERLGGAARALPDVVTYDFSFYVARPEVADAHIDVLAALVRQIRDTQAYANDHADETIAAWAAAGGFDAQGIEQGVFQQLLVDKRLSESLASELSVVSDDAVAATQGLADSFHELGVLPDAVDVTSFLQSNDFAAARDAVAAALEA